MEGICGGFCNRSLPNPKCFRSPCSSAFMSLAAKFPLNSSSKTDCNTDGAKLLFEEPEVCELNPDETIKWHEKPFSQQLDSQSSMTPNRSTDYPRNSEYLGVERTSFTGAHSQSLEEEVLSSQGSFDCSVSQASRGIRNYLGSHSETEDPTMRCKFLNIHGSTLDQIEYNASLEELYHCANGSSLFHEGLKYKQSEVTEEGLSSRLEITENLKWSSSFNQDSYIRSQQQEKAFGVSSHPLHINLESEPWEEEGLEPFIEECVSSWASTASGFSKPKQPGHSGGKITVQHNGQPINQNMATTVLKTLSSEHIVHQEEVHTRSNQLCNNHQEMRKNFQSESASVTMPPTSDVITKMQKSTSLSAADALKLTERSDDDRMTDLSKGKAIESREVQSNAKEPMCSSGNQHGENSSLKPMRRKSQEEKNNATDWDQLRKQVQANGLEKERSKDTMDSLNYEAMRNASVDEISNTIKERGMNNMLAERIKDFLDRLVRDHERIDLEWLRDVPPGKAKDYLLSIRGLGLKSVECVRLLTLHHLAFPVDTNVGRIAVRLGWVPLQPLPESLQLHLLEFARLALPGPPPVHNLLNVGPNGGSSEPIIEEPATPEPEHTEVTQSDIEDAFYEDPDEIPTIKLNMEEFTANLQHYMQVNMELQEGDMSKALVALDPEAASIPTPKLKNVSRHTGLCRS